MKVWRLIDGGPRTALDNIALDSALLRARSEGGSPDTLHFLQYSPAAALIGYFQSTAQELRLDYCRAQGIEVQRRITGGGALYFDTAHLGWEIIGRKSDYGYKNDELTRRMTAGVIAGLRRLGVAAEFRPRNDIEVGGRKISGTGGVFEGDAFLFQGTLLVDLDVEAMLKVLRIPTEKLSAKGLDSARERVTCLREELGGLPPLAEIKQALANGFAEVFGVTLRPGGLTRAEERLAGEFRAEYAGEEWIDMICDPPAEHQILRAALKLDGGLIRVAASVDTRRRYLKYCLITGDFFVSPRRTILDLEAALKNIPLSDVSDTVFSFFGQTPADMGGLEPADFVRAIEAAAGKIELARYGISLADANSVHSINGRFAESIAACSLLLLPYCAKALDCEYRDTDGCDQCGRCSVGDAYAMAKAMGLRAVTIHNYEHLRETLRDCRDSGVKSYVGCCCEAFFVKHQQAFRDAGMAGTLIDIQKDTCYELGREQQAYAGQFENQTELRLELLEQVLRNVREARVA